MDRTVSLLVAGSLLAFAAFAQDNQTTSKPEDSVKKVLAAQDLAGRTFVYIDGAWGQHNFYFRKEGTFKVCGGAKIGCDEGKWSVVDGKLERVYTSWFRSKNHRPDPIAIAVDGKRGTFGRLSADVYAENEPLPGSPYYEDPRK